jgi:Tfp pilus assembly protein PilF
MFRIATFGALKVCLLGAFALVARPQQAPWDWHEDVRKEAEARDWKKALQTVDQVLTKTPQDDDARAWRGRLLLWSGNAEAARTEFLSLTADSPGDPDMWQGLASVYEREGRWDDALHALDRAGELDAHRADLHVERARVLRALNEEPRAREEFRQALAIDPSSAEAKAGLASLASSAKQQVRIGTDNDLFNYTSAYESEWISLASEWSSHWSTSFAGDFFQRGRPSAEKFVASVTGKSERWGAITAGGAVGHDIGIIPRGEAFFDLDHGWRISEDRPLRGVEATYDQHWYWYSTGRILTLSGRALAYLPRDWTWSISITGARNTFHGLPVGWQRSGMSRLNFPLAHWGERNLAGNTLFAVGSEDFALVDEIGSFAAQTYGGGLRFQINASQDASAYAAFQQRTQNRTDTSLGFSYGIHF